MLPLAESATNSRIKHDTPRTTRVRSTCRDKDGSFRGATSPIVTQTPCRAVSVTAVRHPCQLVFCQVLHPDVWKAPSLGLIVTVVGPGLTLSAMIVPKSPLVSFSRAQ